MSNKQLRLSHSIALRKSLEYQLLEPGEAMVQELIPGDGRQQFSYCAFFKQGRAIGSMVAQRRRQHPPEFGRASTFVEPIDLPLKTVTSKSRLTLPVSPALLERLPGLSLLLIPLLH